MENELQEKTTYNDLSEAERKMVFLMRNLRPFERIEIRLNDKDWEEISIVSTSTTKESFPKNVL